MAWLRSRWILPALMVLQAGLLGTSARVHSPTWDEPAHLVAGLSHWQFGRFDLYCVNPPLVRILATAPIHFLAAPDVDWSYYSADPVHRSEIALGRAFVEEHGVTAFDYIAAARLVLIPVALLGLLLCYRFASELTGRKEVGLAAAGLWAVCPWVLGYGAVMTPDLAAAVAVPTAGIASPAAISMS